MSCCCFSRLFILSVVPCLFINLCHWHIRGLREKAVSKCEILRLNYCSYPLYSLPHPAPPLSPSNLPSFCGISQLPSWSHVCWKIQHLFFKERCFSKGSNTTFVVEYVWKEGWQYRFSSSNTSVQVNCWFCKPPALVFWLFFPSRSPSAIVAFLTMRVLWATSVWIIHVSPSSWQDSLTLFCPSSVSATLGRFIRERTGPT